jgi:hypothetical protein
LNPEAFTESGFSIVRRYEVPDTTASSEFEIARKTVKVCPRVTMTP